MVLDCNCMRVYLRLLSYLTSQKIISFLITDGNNEAKKYEARCGFCLMFMYIYYYLPAQMSQSVHHLLL